MSPIDLELQPVDHLTTDAIGQPGKRIFYLQAWQGERTVTLILEKIQLQTMAVGIEQFLAEIQEKFPQLPEASAEFSEDKMHINPPVDPGTGDPKGLVNSRYWDPLRRGGDR